MYENSPPPPGDSSSRGSVNGWLLVLLLVLVGVLVLRTWDFGGLTRYDPTATPRAITPRGDLAEEEKTNISLFKQAKPSVVSINTSTFTQDSFFGNPIEIPQGAGSGFIWDDKGHIVTNFHVLRSAQRATVTLADGTTEDARFVDGDPDNDLAVLKIEVSPDRLRPVPLGESRNLQVGQRVFAIGNPFGLQHSLSTGVISGLGREIQSVSKRTIRHVIQTDASINPGNSGGPLLDSAGRLIGVNTAIYSPSGASAGVGFAVPVDTVNRVVPRLIAGLKVDRPTLGIRPFDLNREEHGVHGVLVYRVLPDSGAAAAGLRGYMEAQQQGGRSIGDIILEVDGKRTSTTNDLLDILDGHEAGDTVTLTILRDDQQQKVKVTLQKRSGD